MAGYYDPRSDDARLAVGNREASREAHAISMEFFNADLRRHKALINRSFILSTTIGLCSAAAVIGAVCGARKGQGSGGISRQATNLFGSSGSAAGRFARLCGAAAAGGLAIALTTLSACVFERKMYNLELDRELWEIDNDLNGEMKEVMTIYTHQGLSEEEAFLVTRIFSQNKHNFANLMMVEELGYSRVAPLEPLPALLHVSGPAFLGFTASVVTSLMPLACVGSRVSPPDVLTASILLLAAETTVAAAVESTIFMGAYASWAVLCVTQVKNSIGVGAAFTLLYAVFRIGA